MKQSSNTQASSSKQIPMRNNTTAKQKPYDLEVRTFEFARDVRSFVRNLPRTIANIEDAKQLVRASGSVGANYIEANESLGKKDFAMRVKICRKEAKEARYWLQLVNTGDTVAMVAQQRDELIREATELLHIFSTIVQKST